MLEFYFLYKSKEIISRCCQAFRNTATFLYVSYSLLYSYGMVWYSQQQKQMSGYGAQTDLNMILQTNKSV